MSFFKTIFVMMVILVISVSCNSPKENDKLGNVYFEATGSPEAVRFFEEGLLLLHSFEFDDAAIAFQSAQEADTTMSMAYWGEAMTYNHPLWAEQDYDKAIAALNRLDASPDQRVDLCQTPIEKDFMQAVNILYGEGAKLDRDIKYKDFMAGMYQKYPESQEAAAFYALSLLGSVPVGRDKEIYEKGAIIAKGILEENPNHPGALHYLIHSYDDPDHASRAVEAANRYMEVASAAGHALHMPSHIYVATGMWDDVVRANELSYQASVDRMTRKNLNNDARGYHAFHWLLYGYLQKGRIADAQTIVHQMKQYTDELPSGRARVHMNLIKGTYMAETQDWDSEIADIPIDQTGLNISIASMDRFISGMRASAQGNKKMLKEQIDVMEKERTKVAIQLENKGIAFCTSVSRESQKANQLDVDQAYIMEMELRSLLADMDGNTTEAESWLKQAVELETNISYSYGPPAIVKPSFEMYGEWLNKNDRAQEALKQFDYSLVRAPKRVLSLKGKLEAARKTGDSKLENELNLELEKILQKSDVKPTLSKI